MRTRRPAGPMLRAPLRALALCAALGSAPAQDSTALGPGLPGDALDPHLASEQVNDFVVDMSAFRSSADHVFAVAPVLKASAQFLPAPTFFTAQISAQAISVDQRYGLPFPRDAYALWTAPGRGVNGDSTLNLGPTGSIDTRAAVGNQIALAFAEFSSNDPTSATIHFNNLIAGVVNYDPDHPSRLYVSRIVAAANSPTWFCDLAQLGFGGIDSNGFAHLRADAFGSFPCGSLTEVQGQNLYRIATLARSPGVLNVLSSTGGSDATAHLVQNSVTCSNGSAHTHSPATQIPSTVTGGLPILLGSAFSCPAAYSVSQIVHGDSAPLSYSTGQIGGGATDTRGLVSYSKASFTGLFGASATHGTAAMIGLQAGTNRIQMFGLSASGAPVGTISRALPAVIVDNDDGWPSNSLGAGSLRFNNYQSQVAFRGGNGQVAVGRDQGGDLIAAASVDHPNGSGGGHPNNLIAVARTDAAGNTSWTIAAWVANSTGKEIYDGAGTSIGNLFTLGSLTGGSPGGPSFSSPMIDSVGNVWLVAPVDLASGESGIGLVRAVYDRASFSYRLELVLRTGDVFRGQNSDRDYRIASLTIADSNSIDSGAAWSGNVMQDAHAGLDPATLPTSSSESLGGLALAATIVYDVDQDGSFERLQDVPSTADQEYNVVLLVGHAKDCNRNGVPDDLDLLRGTSTDQNGDGIPDDCGPGAAFCFGDGSGTSCPCGNTGGPGQGCANSTGQGGVLLATGSGSVAANDLVVLGDNMLPSQPALLFCGNNAVNGGNGTPFGDGLRCAGGGVRRLGVRLPDAGGAASWGPGLNGAGGWQSGDTRHIQSWYRNPTNSPCGANFNLSHGLRVTFQP